MLQLMDQKVPGLSQEDTVPPQKNFKKAQPPENILLQNSPTPLKSGGFIP